jgi:hypothetical protein
MNEVTGVLYLEYNHLRRQLRGQRRTGQSILARGYVFARGYLLVCCAEGICQSPKPEYLLVCCRGHYGARRIVRRLLTGEGGA